MMIIQKLIQYGITSADVIYHIQSNFRMLHPIRGIIPAKLTRYQKMLVQKIIDGRYTIIKQDRQMGLTTLFILILQTMKQLVPQISTKLVTQLAKHLNHITKVNNIPIDIESFDIVNFKQQIYNTDFVIMDINKCYAYTPQFDKMLNTINIDATDSKYIVININDQNTNNFELWNESLLYKTKFVPIYLPKQLLNWTQTENRK